MKKLFLILLAMSVLAGCSHDTDESGDPENIASESRQETEAETETEPKSETETETETVEPSNETMPHPDSFPEESVREIQTSDGTVIGYAVQDENDLYAYYDLRTEKYLTDFEWAYINLWWESDGKYLLLDSVGENFQLLLETETSEIIGKDREFGKFAMTVQERSGVVFFLTSDYYSTFGRCWIYTEDMIPISDSPFRYASITNDGNLLALPLTDDGSDDVFHIYNSAGKLIGESEKYDSILFICRDWIYVADEGRLRIIDADGNIAVDFCEWNENMMIHPMLSGYKNESPAQEGAEDPWKYYYFERNENGEYIETDTETYPEGLYFLTEDNNIEYGTKGHAKEYFWNPDSGLTGMLAWGEVGGYAKPVLYLYPEEECEVSVSFDRPELLTTVYPSYNNGWTVTASPSGTLTDARGREYYALYWEESGSVPVDFSEGFCVSSENAAEFLEEKLDKIGLTNREANEMIMYWLPILERNKYSFVYFELTDSRDAYNRLIIDPVPDSILRIAIHIREADGYEEISEQALPSWERNGFSAVEWGGVVWK